MRIADNLVAHLVAEQVVNGHAERLALDVPQGDVDGGDGRGEDALCREEAAAEEHLPDVFAVHGVLADEQRLEVLDRADHRQFAAGNAGLAHAVQPLVRVHHDKQEVAMPAPYRVALDVSDLHRSWSPF